MTHDINRTANCIERLKETIAIADINDYEMVGIETHVPICVPFEFKTAISFEYMHDDDLDGDKCETV